MRSLGLALVTVLLSGLLYANESPKTDISNSSASSKIGDRATELAKKRQNPVSDLTSVPFQSNFGLGAGPDKEFSYLLNLQPVVPFRLNQEWSLISRMILPYLTQPFGNGRRESGLIDLSYTAYFSPNYSKNNIFWGLGPTFLFPTATRSVLSTGKWSAGPSAVFVWMSGPWVLVTLSGQIWSFAGSSERRSVSSFFIQPILNYNLANGWSISSSPLVTANWNEARGKIWTLPVGAGISKTFAGEMPISLMAQGYYNLTKTTFEADWQLRFILSFLFPKKAG